MKEQVSDFSVKGNECRAFVPVCQGPRLLNLASCRRQNQRASSLSNERWLTSGSVLH